MHIVDITVPKYRRHALQSASMLFSGQTTSTQRVWAGIVAASTMCGGEP